VRDGEGDGEGRQPALGPHVGMHEMESRKEGWRGYWVLQGAERGTQAGHGWQRNIPSVCGHLKPAIHKSLVVLSSFTLKQGY